MAEPIRVAVSGACGRMGQEVVRTVLAQGDMRLVGAVDITSGVEVGGGIVTSPDIESALAEAQVLVDFTRGDVAPDHIETALRLGVACVVGTTGIASERLEAIGRQAHEGGVPVLLAPNFALGAVLMMRFAREAARYYEWAEIIEMHHENKVDSPSGTALRTAQLMREVGHFKAVPNESAKLAGARGAECDNIRIHSIRLAGLVAHQEVLLGGEGETLTLRHDSMSRTSFMAGVMLAVRRIRGRRGLIVGLEHLMD